MSKYLIGDKAKVRADVAAATTFEALRSNIQDTVERILGNNEDFVASYDFSVGEKIGYIAYRVSHAMSNVDVSYLDIVKIVRCYFTPEDTQR